MFERFTASSRRALFFAGWVARGEEFERIEPRHILVGVLWKEGDRWKDERIYEIFDKYRIDPEPLFKLVKMRAEAASPSQRLVPFSQDTKAVLLKAIKGAELVEPYHVGSEHLVLGILDEGR